MKQLLVLAILLASSVAAAQSKPNCKVTIVRAPDDVRKMIESWVQAEPNCSTTLEVRVVPTDGGLYLLARDSYGRMRERVVPDSQSAGVLVASWVAADSNSAGPYDVRKPEPFVAPTPTPPSAMLGSEGMLAPGEGAAPGAAPVIATTPKPAPPRWLSLGGVFGVAGADGGGLRGEYDWRTRGRLAFGLVASTTHSQTQVFGNSYEDMGTMQMFDMKLLANAVYTARSERWALRTSLGAGIVYTMAELEQTYVNRAAGGLFPTAELTASVGRDLGDNWALTVGPVISVYIQKYEIENSSPQSYSYSLQRRDAEVMMFFAARYRL